jgi:3'(2'), 5'-bisphosphate nucleotidase
MNTNKELLILSILASIAAGDKILEVYETDFSVTEKSDKTPLTLADQKSHTTIMSFLEKTPIPVLSEEGRDIPFEERSKWERLWIVDPLDGTKEFIKRNGEFTVNIALVEKGMPILGVIFIPVKNVVYFALKGEGCWRLSDTNMISHLKKNEKVDDSLLENVRNLSKKLSFEKATDSIFTVVGSRSHPSPELETFVKEKEKKYERVQMVSAGSSLKFCLVAEQKADIYPRFGPTMEWDTAAGQAIAEGAGAGVFRMDDGSPLAYNKPDLLNPFFKVYYPENK